MFLQAGQGLRTADHCSVHGVSDLYAKRLAELADGVGAEVALPLLVLGNRGRRNAGIRSKLGLSDATQSTDGFEFVAGEHGCHCRSPVAF